MIIFQSVLLSRFISNWRKDRDSGQGEGECNGGKMDHPAGVQAAKPQESSSEASNRQ